MGGKAALILVAGFGFIFGYLAIQLNELESRTVDNTSKYLEVTTSHNLAVSATNAGLARLYQDTTLWNRTTDTIINQQTFSSGVFQGGSFTVRFGQQIGTSLRLMATSVLVSGARTFRDTVVVLFNRLSMYDILGLMVGFKGNDDTWISRDTMWGRVQFNGRVAVKGSPVYNDKVSVSKGFSPGVGTGTNQAIFMNGYETGVNPVPLPSLSDTADCFPARDTTLYGDWSIQLRDTVVGNNNGFAIFRNNLHNFTGGGGLIPFPYNTYVDPFKGTHGGVILVRGNVSVKGVVDGRLTIATTGNIYIDDDITYAANPQVGSSDDILGLVAIGDLVVYQHSAGKGEYTVQAVGVSLNGTLSADYPNSFVGGVLRSYGGLLAPDRTNIGQYSNSGGGSYPYLTRGFYRRFRWDSRLGDPIRLRPPGMPTPDDVPGKLQIVNWWENVRIPEY